MAVPACRFAINRRISGDPHRWPLEEFARAVGGRTFRNALSLGCGTGNLERAVRKIGLCESIVGIDFSRTSVEIARDRAREEGVEGIEYRIGDLNNLRLPKRTYDAIFIHQALHHVSSVEKLLGRVARALTTDGYLFLDEWVGPSNTEWTKEALRRATRLYGTVPREWRLYDSFKAPIVAEDPSEAVRSSAILPAVRLFFETAERPYGGHLVPLLLCQMTPESQSDPRFAGFLERMLWLEDEDLERDPSCSYHVAIGGRPFRGLRQTWAQLRGLGRRARLFVRYRTRAVWNRVRA